MRTRRLALDLLLALLLVLSQQQALQHALAHGLEALAGADGGAPHEACCQCLGLACLDSFAASSAAAAPRPQPARRQSLQSAPTAADLEVALAYLSRAPPQRA